MPNKTEKTESERKMSYRNKKDIRVFNECPFQVNLVGQRREYIFPPCMDGEPTMNFVDFDEIEYAHSRWNTFRIGLLTFNEEDQEGMYEALGIKNWRDTVWFNKDIEDTIMNPTMEKMQRIINIREMIALERVRGMMVRFINEKRDVSQNVIRIVNARFRELNANNLTSKIVLQANEIEAKPVMEDVNELKRQNAEMQKMMKELLAQVAELKGGKTEVENTAKSDPPAAPTAETPAPKKPTRKPAAKK